MLRKSLLLACLVMSGNVFAQMAVDVLGAAYTTDLSLAWGERPSGDSPTVTKTMTRNATITAAISNTITSPNNPKRFATASAGVFNVSAGTSAFPNATFTENSGTATAVAKSYYTFSPRSDGLAPLSFQIAGNGATSFSAGLMRLVDLTTHQSLFNYSWNGFGGAAAAAQGIPPGISTNIPGFDFSTATGALAFGTQLFDSHNYGLTLFATTNANTDLQSVAIRMAGLQPVSAAPEPETWAMMLLGLGFIGYIVPRQRASLAQARRLARGG